MDNRFWGICFLIFLLTGCFGGPAPPQNPNNICEIFDEHASWYKSAYASYRKWGIPIPVLMAIIYQESRYQCDARPPRTTCLFIFPGPRPSTAYGYSQALDTTWEKYMRKSGNHGADRDDFEDAVDFIGWYCNLSHHECRIGKNDAYSLYLAYHEGHGGFNRRTFKNKTWLKRVALKVKQKAAIYARQFNECEYRFRSRGGCFLWPF